MFHYQRNGDGGDLRMTLKNDLASHVNGSERIVRRKEDVEDKNGEKEERRIVVKDEKEVEERKVRYWSSCLMYWRNCIFHCDKDC